MRYLVPILLITGGLLGLDYYVYRNWRRFARGRRRLRWTLPVYRVLIGLMPLAMPLYFSVYRWWETEPRLARAVFFGWWTLYYLPKVPIAAVLLVKDAARLLRALRRSLRPEGASGIESKNLFRVDRSAPAPYHGPRSISADDVPARDGSTAMNRAEFLRTIGWSAAAVPFIATAGGILGTLYDFSVRRIDVPIAGLPRAFDGVTIAQISDLHAGSFLDEEPIRQAVSLVRELRPDLIAVTGDFVNNDTAELPVVIPALRELRADLGVFGCLGNHDHYADTDELVGRIGATPVELIINAHRTLEIDGAELHIIGTDNTGFSQHYGDLPRAVEGIDPDRESAQILLAHDPTFWDRYVRPDFEDIDLMLCGHTHGGQIGFEIGPLQWSLARLRYDRWAGLYEESRPSGNGRQFLYVNRGLGTVGPPLRLGIQPEITLLTLRRG